MTAIADPPADLRDQGRALWADIQMRYHLDPAEEAMLRQLCRVVDEIDAMMTAMEAAPFVVPGSHGQLKAHPLIRGNSRAPKAGRIALPHIGFADGW